MGSKELSSPCAVAKLIPEHKWLQTPLVLSLNLCQTENKAGPDSQTFLNYTREEKKRPSLQPGGVRALEDVGPALPPHPANWETLWEKQIHSQSLTRTTTKCSQPNLGFIYPRKFCPWVLLQNLSKTPARCTKHKQHQQREVQLTATYLISASLCVYWTSVWNEGLGKISIPTAH